MRISSIILSIAIAVTFSGCQHNKSPQNTTESKMRIKKEDWGKADNKNVYLFTITNVNGISIKVSNYGGIITSILTPDKNGDMDDIVLGYDNLNDYIKDTPYFGCIVGRYANRIANGKFELEGQIYNLAVNNGKNHLHGGIKAFDKVVWDVTSFKNEDEAGIELHYLSPDGEEGYPGNLNTTVKYSLTNKNELVIKYEATSDKATPVNLTHHSYFNLAGSKGVDILNHELRIDADFFTPVDESQIPTGELRNVAGTPMDFRKPMIIGDRINEVEGGYDHNYVLNPNDNFGKAAELFEKESGRLIEVFTTEPGIQFYTGNFLDGSLKGKNGIVYKKHFGLCLETQHFPDSPNQPEFPNTILKPGKKFSSKTVYKFSVRKG